jgi:hypothetical protein
MLRTKEALLELLGAAFVEIVWLSLPLAVKFFMICTAVPIYTTCPPTLQGGRLAGTHLQRDLPICIVERLLEDWFVSDFLS